MATSTTTTKPTNRALISNFFDVLISTTPTSAQLDTLAARVDSGVSTLSETLNTIYQSPSRVSGPADDLARLFFLLFDHAPDFTTFVTAFKALRAGGTLAQLANIGLSLPGYSLSSDGLSDKDFLNAVYYKMAGTSLGDADLNKYSADLASGKISRGDVMAAVTTLDTGYAYPSASKIQASLLYLAVAQREASSTELAITPAPLSTAIESVISVAGLSVASTMPYFILSATEFGSLSVQNSLGSDLVFNLELNKYQLNGSSGFKALFSGDGGSSSSIITFPTTIPSISGMSLDAHLATGSGKINFTGRNSINNHFTASDAGSTAQGGTLNDTLIGGAGVDNFTATSGNDVFTGGDGADVFTFAPSPVYLSGGSSLTITDFGRGSDTLDFSKLLNLGKVTATKATPILATSTAEAALVNGDVKVIENNGVWTTGTGTSEVARSATAADVMTLFGTGKALANPTETGKYVVLTADIRNGADVWLINNDTGVTAITDGTTGPNEIFLIGHIDGSWNLMLSQLAPVPII